MEYPDHRAVEAVPGPPALAPGFSVLPPISPSGPFISVADIFAPLELPKTSYFTPASDPSPRDSYISAENNSQHALAHDEKPEDTTTAEALNTRRKRLLYNWPLICCALLALALLIVVIVLPVYFRVIKPNQRNAIAGSSSGSAPPPPSPSVSNAITGGNGSIVTMNGGTQFTYINPFGGFWVDNPNDPFNNNAQPNSWTPPLNTSWTWGQNRVYGVNLGGWFVLEPFISPALFQKYPGTVDEWTLSIQMAADTASGGLKQLEAHYQTFYTEQDFAEIAGAGLNWVRLPIPFWAIEVWPGEPFLAQTCWKYILQALGWCRKYGLRVNLDLHTIPGSQNGYIHSGRGGEIDFLNGPMGIANAQRAMEYIRVITEFISQPEYQSLVPVFSIMNEPLAGTIGKTQMAPFYIEAQDMIRQITGLGEGNGPYICIHDSFEGLDYWATSFTGADRLIIDTHPYVAFNGQPNLAPVDTGTGPGAGGVWPAMACGWGGAITTSSSTFGVTIAGEFSAAINDCGLYVNGVGGGASYGGDCSVWEDASGWDDSTKAGLRAFVMASMDALQDWFFWTWKIGDSAAGTVQAPLWSYQLGLAEGYVPADPRSAIGTCAAIGSPVSPFDGPYLAWQTGGPGAGAIDPSDIAAAGPYPPSISLVPAAAQTLIATYTSTGTVPTLPPTTFTRLMTTTVDPGDGWYNSADTGAGVTTVAGCSYPPDAWRALEAPIPTAPCGDDPVVPAPAPVPAVATDPAAADTGTDTIAVRAAAAAPAGYPPARAKRTAMAGGRQLL